MKKLIIAAVVILTASFTACTKDNSVQPTSVKAKTLGAKNEIGQADGAKNEIGQADGAKKLSVENAKNEIGQADGAKNEIGQADGN
ncbi:hypothetical protein [Mucilaginibacter sp. KACC 22063]|uniref:hypothetical protein n=1 Tax=Mucilaginibacter sp. KACC 22063 TaxID=3025666 RepID=UPI00236694AD|nr:hypothetical protein [Mucilaginibacter sp. KACC 22063]WDF54044.1 hypothetical protein PQ461_13945 [Mucilaginibacter sp. KACC 22063]